jgi:glyoxylase-like metal-dependent hydrolase (beta-lactamase superfamily II)
MLPVTAQRHDGGDSDMRAGRRWLIGGAVAAVFVLLALAWGSGPLLRPLLFSKAMPTSYFSHFDYIRASLYQVSGPVYAFERGFTRSLVLRTQDGIAIVDTFSDVHATALKSAIEQQFPREPVRWVIFSHNHLDHIRGSAMFSGAEVIGHADTNELVRDWPEAGQGVAAVTRPITGDQTLQLGGLEVHALYMPFSHSHTLYGFHVPSAGVVYAPDMMFVKTLPPFDFPDFYYPGYVRALDRLIGIDATHYVPSHTDRGSKQDLMDFREMTVAFQTVVRDEILSHGVESPTDGTALRESLRAAYAKLQPRYGSWHGFDDMFVPKFGRHVGGTYLGY